VNPRKILRIARWEVSRNAGTINRATIALVVVGAALGILVGPAIVSQGVDFDRGIYRVGLDDDSPYRAVVQRNSQFVATEASVEDLETGTVDLAIEEGRVYYEYNDQKSRAAYDEFRNAVQRYNDYLMRQEPNESAAFPINVSLEYRSQVGTEIRGAGAGDSGEGDGGGDGSRFRGAKAKSQKKGGVICGQLLLLF